MLEKSGLDERKIISAGNNDMKSTVVLDYSKMFQDFRWKPQIPLIDGITNMFRIDPSEKNE
jgi:nucleoside-diphosphate-sugar epimerase